ncbi:MAG: hypothetical protein HY887_05335 [Deltaproteobacteria bacterium]|nr:hypothetical protein [Deltaproteobacteria bacterium]
MERENDIVRLPHVRERKGRPEDAVQRLKPEKEELERRINYLEEFRAGVLQMLKDLDASERELKSAYSELKETHGQLVQSCKLSALGELSAGMAHEMNQPLTVIKGLTQSLLRSKKDEDCEQEKLNLILDAVKRMEALVTHLRIFTRMDEGERKEVDINRVVSNAFLLIGKALAGESVNVVMNLGPVPFVLGSEGRLEQVVINLAANARDAMTPGGGILTITTALVEKHGAGFVELCAADTGRGMPEEVASKIFDPFFTTKEPGKGTGLGLTISSGIIKEHGGSIYVESAPGKGTTLRVLIPSAR